MTFSEISRQAVDLLKIGSEKQYRLKYKKTLLDPSMQIRFASSLSPNATLDLVVFDESSEKFKNAIVKVVFQLPQGRFTSEHRLSHHIPDILLSLQSAGSLMLVKKTSKSLQLPILNVSGRNYCIEEWRAMRLSDVSDANGVLIRVHWVDTKYSEDEIERMLLIKPSNNNESQSSGIEESAVEIIDDIEEVNTKEETQVIPPPNTQVAMNRPYNFVDISQLSTSSLGSEEVASFDLSPSQAKQLAESFKNRTTKLLEAPLVSKRALLAKQRSDLLAQYPRIIFRIRLPNAQIVEVLFDSTELGEALYSFVRGIIGTEQDILLLSAGHVIDHVSQLIDQGLAPKTSIIVHTQVTTTS
jgi:hypothetical protein